MAWVEKYTVGNGDCAFNAFVGALEHELKRIPSEDPDERDSQFIQSFRNKELFIEKAARALGVANNADAVLQAICAEPQSEILQTKLGPVFRQLSIELIRRNKAEHRRLTKLALIAAFNHDLTGDDIFSKHPHIKAYAGNENELGDWWEREGHEKFLQNMENLDLHYWAGDLELVPLAKYFGVNLNVRNKNTGQMAALNLNNGEFPIHDMDYLEVKELIHRGILSGEMTEDEFENVKHVPLPIVQMTEAELSQRLSAVPNHDEMSAYLRNLNLKDKEVPAEWKTSNPELVARGILTAKKDGKLVFVSNFALAPIDRREMSLNDALTRLSEVENKDAIVAKWKQNKKDTLTVNLSNPYALHWSTLVLEDAQPVKMSDSNSTLFAKMQPLENNWENICETFVKKTQGKEHQTHSVLETYIRKHGNQSHIDLRESDIRVVDKANGSIRYHIGNKEILVDTATQIFLDQQFAKRLQEEENKLTPKFNR